MLCSSAWDGAALVADATEDNTSDSAASAPADAGDGAVLVADAAEDRYLDLDAVVACSSLQDCPLQGPPFVPGQPLITCCIDKICVFGQSAIDAVPCTDANAQPIQTSSYDTSCQADSDCVAVVVGNFCYAPGRCPSGAINKGAYAQYQADVARTNAVCNETHLGCPLNYGPCCRNHACQMGLQCLSDAETGTVDAAADSEADGAADGGSD